MSKKSPGQKNPQKFRIYVAFKWINIFLKRFQFCRRLYQVSKVHITKIKEIIQRAEIGKREDIATLMPDNLPKKNINQPTNQQQQQQAREIFLRKH